MNRESIPLLLAVVIPILLVVFIFLRYNKPGFVDYISTFIPRIDPLYYIILAPFLIGLLAAVLMYRKMR